MQAKKISTLKGQDVKIVLLPEENYFSNVVVTGYQTLSKERVTGAFNVVTPEELKGKLQTDIISRLEGKTAGMVQQNGNYFIRGIATLPAIVRSSLSTDCRSRVSSRASIPRLSRISPY